MDDLLTFGPLGGAPLTPDFRDIPLSATQEFKEVNFRAVGGTGSWHSSKQPWLDQGTEGACVGFAITNLLNANPKPGVRGNKEAFDFYHRITVADRYEGDWRTGQSGTSIRDGAKQAKSEGLFSGYAFTADVDVMLKWLMLKGPLYVGVPWYRSMDKISQGYARIFKDSGIRGWHSISIDGYDLTTGDEYKDNLVYPNSWNHKQEFKLSVMGLRFLMSHPGAGAITPVERI